jgi:hypothetical protein
MISENTHLWTRIEAGISGALPYVLMAVLVCWSLFSLWTFVTLDARVATDADYRTNSCFFRSQQAGELPFDLDGCLQESRSSNALIQRLLIATDKIVKVDAQRYELFHLPFLLCFLVGSFFLGRAIGGPWLGLVAVFFASALPILDLGFRRYDLPVHSAAVAIWVHAVALAIANREGTPRLRWFVLFGATWGASVLVHPVGLLLGMPAAGLLLWNGVRRRRERSRYFRAFPRRMGIGILAFFLVCRPVLLRLWEFVERTGVDTSFGGPGSPEVRTSELISLLGGPLFLFLTAISVAAIILGIAQRKLRFQYPFFSALFFLVATIFLWSTHSATSSVALTFLFAPLWAVASIHFSVRSMRSKNAGRWALGWAAALVLLIIFGVLERHQSFTETPIGGDRQNFRSMVFKTDASTQLLQALQKFNSAQRIEFMVKQVRVEGESVVELELQPDTGGKTLAKMAFDAGFYLGTASFNLSSKPFTNWPRVELNFIDTPDGIPEGQATASVARYCSRLKNDPETERVIWRRVRRGGDQNLFFPERYEDVILRQTRR